MGIWVKSTTSNKHRGWECSCTKEVIRLNETTSSNGVVLLYAKLKRGYPMLMKFCPKCRKIIEQGNNYCDDCQAKIDDNKKATKAKYMRQYDQTKRNPAHVTFYNSLEWLTLRAVKLSQANYLCECCKDKGVTTIATEVHHVVTIKDDWDKRLDIMNLRCLCKDCHNDEHSRYQRNKKSKR